MRLSIKSFGLIAVLAIAAGATFVALSLSSKTVPIRSSSSVVEPLVEVNRAPDESESSPSTTRTADTTDTAQSTSHSDIPLGVGVGESLGIQWKRKPVPSYSIEGDLATEYEHLRELAEENAEAAYQLWTILDSCKFAFEAGSDLENALNTLSETQSVRLPGMHEPRFVGEESSRNWREALEMSFDICSGITEEMKFEKNAWLKKASDGGYPLAMMHYSEMEHDPDTALDLAERRWQAGDADAMRTMYELYQQDYESGIEPGNKVTAYAHLLVYKLISEKKWGPGSRRLERFLPEFGDASRQMLPHELTEAEALARRLIESNPACCFRH